MSIYTDLKAAGVETDNNESDLYAREGAPMHALNKCAWHEFCAYFQALELPRLRRAYIEAHMAERGKTYREIAARHRMSAWYLAAAVIGKQPMARKHVAALEADLDIKLTAWLTPEESKKINKQ